MDPKIAPVVQAATPANSCPNHGFRLIRVKGERDHDQRQTVRCDLGDGFVANGPPQQPARRRLARSTMQVRPDARRASRSSRRIVATPPDQFNFFDKALGNGNRLLVGVGAR